LAQWVLNRASPAVNMLGTGIPGEVGAGGPSPFKRSMSVNHKRLTSNRAAAPANGRIHLSLSMVNCSRRGKRVKAAGVEACGDHIFKDEQMASLS
jgi:hypothetical protein